MDKLKVEFSAKRDLKQKEEEAKKALVGPPPVDPA